uniref:BOS complex subunit NCLN n=1 Tax=Evadne anonyx TaxID=141404 RepID=A0A9N6WX07_9CRUS|nr:EOG090X02MW [Evadne anonyx]
MWLDQVNEISEMFRFSLPYYIAALLPILIILSPADAAHEFPVYRLQHFDLQGVKYGSRSSALNFEARSIDTKLPARKCVMLVINEFSVSRFRELVNEGVGAILIIIPADLDSITEDLKEHIVETEKFLLSQEVSIPIFFSPHTQQVDEIYSNIIESTNKDSAPSAAQALLGSISANGYQLGVSGNQAKILNDVQISNIQGKLSGFGVEEQLQTVAVVAHYDSFGGAPDLSFGGDSNGSGVAALMELVRLFSRLASQPGQNGLSRFNLVFVLTGGGKLNYLGSKKILEDQLDGVDGGLFQDTGYVLCLDSLGKGEELNVHVSKPPKEGSKSFTFVENMKNVAGDLFPAVGVNVQHKKINLADDFLAWEHERYSIRRLSALTVSHYKAPKSDYHRGTILDTRSSVDIPALARNVRILAESLASQLYNTSGPFFEGDMVTFSVKKKEKNIFKLLNGKPNPIVHVLQQTMQRYLTDVKVTHLTADKRDPEFAFYDQTKTIMTAYSVKPAIFDLFLSGAIAAYITAVYFGVQQFHLLYSLVTKGLKSKSTT